ncbi:hypothetical protein SAMN05444287_2582 [Octadecabacter temperatus]|uniref:Uncharacterized protein n=2 Tax=Octadecabacter temperatus TaxID=1458307 RepID=A0A0K0YA14_9RHOB|nr:hypothetical protein OSB_32480 [Octadecabacter temperatus]SIO38843.1 hypothetical protein SAMN05444287_2582 [Octadecabacter temperatus]
MTSVTAIPCGFFTMFLALGAVGSGLMLFHIPILTSLLFALLMIWVIYEYKGRRYDGYRVAHGYGLEHPHNKNREHL